uniref:Uncharacterized protein n=1 Tax=Podoviridae sp. ct90d35 TaxID=2827724 RepID=A0A8S5TNH4_9CAUD|nr:MAG TPA: hypothetical protein [Podoviridae sp. ct90d35]
MIARISPKENSAPPELFSFALNLDKLTPILDATSSWVIDLARISPFSKALFILYPSFHLFKIPSLYSHFSICQDTFY